LQEERLKSINTPEPLTLLSLFQSHREPFTNHCPVDQINFVPGLVCSEFSPKLCLFP
jgi:hypothetical protein